MKIDNRTKELIAVGASVTANCQPCLQFHAAKARENGSDEEELSVAIAVAEAVRKGASAKMDDFAASLCGKTSQDACAANEGCSCGS